MKRSAILDTLPVRWSDFVVEIGAGPTPFKYTKLILDKYPFDNLERYGDIQNVAPVIKADAMKIPLANKSCDLLFVSHVLEHIDRPELFIQEARRCSKVIYLEFPTTRRELMYAWSFHKWLIEIDHERLVFYRNDIPQIFGDFFHRHYDFLLDVWSEERFLELNNSIYIESDRLTFEFSKLTAFEYILQSSAKDGQRINFRSEYGCSGTGAVSYARSLLLKIMIWVVIPEKVVKLHKLLMDKLNVCRKPELTREIVSRLVCQKCREKSLVFVDGTAHSELMCGLCQMKYVKKRGIFDFDI